MKSATVSSIGLSKRSFKIVLLGDAGAGKTCITERFVNGRFQDKDNPTIGIDFLSRNYKYRGDNYRLQLWDPAGDEKFRNLIPTYLKEVVCAIFVFDVSAPATLKHIHEWVAFFNKHRTQRTVMLLCGAKSDKEANFDPTYLTEIREKYSLPFLAVSAKNNSQVDELIQTSLESIISLHEERSKRIKKSMEATKSTIEDDIVPQTNQRFNTQTEFHSETTVDIKPPQSQSKSIFQRFGDCLVRTFWRRNSR